MPRTFLDVDPRDLRVSSRAGGADPAKLQRQISQFGSSMVGMQPIWVVETADGALVITNGVTRVTRIAKLAPGTLVRVEVIAHSRRSVKLPRIGDLLP